MTSPRRAATRAPESEEETVAGRIVHFEIPADDTAQARGFWGGLFGWEFQEFEGAPVEYHMGSIDEASGVAVHPAEGGARGARAYFDVDDIRASVARVAELGGEAGDPMPVPSMGWFAYCRDPHGNDFGLWQTDPDAPAPAM
jgi:hypothetical protein